jgi:protease secretion system outer membrane protein
MGQWKPVYGLLVGVLIIVATEHGYAIGLEEAYEEALQNDPVYRSAQYERDAGEKNLALGRSKLLPNVSIDYQKGTNLLGITNVGTSGLSLPGQQLNFVSQITTLSLRQPLFNLGNYATYRQGQAQANYSDAQFAGHAQDLGLRLVQAYTDALYARDQLNMVQAQHDTYGEQMRSNERMFQMGHGTLTDTLETQSKYALSESLVVEAQQNLEVSKRNLEIIVGEDLGELDPLCEDFHSVSDEQIGFDDWKSLATEHNPDIVAQRHAVEIADQEVNKSLAGHAPQLDLVGSISRNNQGTIYTYSQDMFERSIGVELNIPLYAGGYVSTLADQAKSNSKRARANLEDISNKIYVDLYRQHTSVQSSLRRIRALEQAVDTARKLIEATQKSIQGGERVNLDLLNARSQYYQARQDLAKARYDYINAFLRLKADAGVLSRDDIKAVAGYFSRIPPKMTGATLHSIGEVSQ